MKLSKETLQIMNGLSQINTNLVIKEGNRLSSCSPARNIFAFVDIEESFDKSFGIYDLREFLGAVAVFDNPEIEFTEKYAKIGDDTSSIVYVSADPSILIAPKRHMTIPTVDVEFDMSADLLGKIVKSASILKVGVVSFIGDGKSIVIKVHDKTNDSSNQFKINVGDTDKTFAVHFKVELLKMPIEDYTFQISKQKIGQFVGDKKVYIVGAEVDSSFEE